MSFKSNTLAAGIALALAAPYGAQAADSAELAQIREQIKQMKESYEARIQALEKRLREAVPEASPSHAGAAAEMAASHVIGAPAPVHATRASENALNPSLSLILSGTYTNLSQDPATYALPGFALGDEASPGSRGWGINQTELHFGANIDPDMYGTLALILNPDNTVALEEAYFQTTGLGNGLTVRGGRFFSGIGAINQKHPHAWDFVDAPLAYRAFLNYQYGDDGLQVRWVAPTDTFVELGGEALKGNNFVAGGNGKNGIGAHSLFAHLGDDVGTSQSWRAGLSYLNAKPSGRESGNIAGGQADTFSGDSKLWTADFLWKWAPNGNPAINNALIQGEYIRRKESGLFTGNASGITGNYSAQQSGWYAQGLYQFMPRWRVGLRYDRLATQSLADASGTLADTNYSPSRQSAILEFAKSEFGRFRLQYNNDKSRPDSADHQLYLQYQLSLGAHGAHQY